MDFCKNFNAKTAKDEGLIIPVVVTVYADRVYSFITKTPPAAVLLKRAANIAKGSAEPNKTKVGTVTAKQVEEIAQAEDARPERRHARGRGQDRGGHGAVDGAGRHSVAIGAGRSGRSRPMRRRVRWEGPRSEPAWTTGGVDAKVRQEVRRRQGAGAPTRPLPLEDAVPLVQKVKYAKFDETVELAFRLGVDPKHADQMVRGTVVLPHGLGKTKQVLAIAGGEKQKEAQEAGADIVAGEEMVEKIQGGWMDFEAVVATPDMMRSVGRLGKVLGPRGLMPNPKTGTVTFDIGKAVREIKAGKVEFRVDKTGHRPRAGRQGVVPDRAPAGERPRARREHREGEARGGQGQVPEERHAVARRWGPAIRIDTTAIEAARR